MLNPDGVVLGNYRTGVAGRDLNRSFLANNKTMFPTVEAIKSLVKDTKVKIRFFFF
jgi:murein tripeptide amidase MpaA